MSRAFTKEDAWEEPVIPQRAPLPEGVPNYVTPRGLEALHAEQAALEAERQGIDPASDDELLRRKRLALARPFARGDIARGRARGGTCEGPGDGPGDSEAGLARFLARNPGPSPIAEKEGVIVGAALCGHDGRRGFLYRVGIAPTHRRQGIAQ